MAASNPPRRRVRLCDFIRDHQDEILRSWEALVRAQPVARDLPALALRDHLPALLRRIAGAVETVHGGGERSLEGLPELHALGRLDIGYDLDALVQEYALLRACVLRLYRERVGPDARLAELERFDACVDEAIQLSVVRYASARARTLLALDRFALAAFGKHDVAALLRELLEVVVQTVDAVDMGAVFVFERERLRVVAATGMDEEFPKLELEVGEGFAGLVAARRRPMELRDAGHSPIVKLRALPPETRALYGVPLEEEGRLVGVAYMGSRTANELAPADTILLRAMASRATSVLVQARLRRAEQAERARADAERRLLEAIVRELPVAVAVAEAPSGRLLLGNAALEAVCRRPAGADPRALAAFGPDGRRLSPAEWPLERAIAGERVDQVEIVLERGDGSRAVTVQSATPVRDAEGRVVAGVAVFVDITERKGIEERLTAAGEFRESFIGILSHDLRNLVSTISGTASLLLSRGALDERSAEMVSRIARTAQRMTRMVRDLLDFTRGRLGGGIPAVPQPVDLAQLCRDFADEFRTAHPDRVFHVEAAGDLSGRWDPDRIAQALANLCKNAIDYGAPGTAVELRACAAGEGVEVSVANAGGPIAPEALPTLFDPYRRASDRRPRSGLGLGLFIVREIARAHGGTVEPTSTGDRVVFTLRLPRDGRVTPRAGSEAARP